MASKSFTVHLSDPELVPPAKPTPREFKYLSNIDNQLGLRNHIPFAHIYCATNTATTTDPARLVRCALSRALVHYYPLAGCLRNAKNGKLVLECTGKGALFREADADGMIQQLQHSRDGFVPPFPQWDQLLADDVYGSFCVTDSPLLRMQVTRFACGGFVLAYCFNHCACDAAGALQFITAVAELARNPHFSNPSLLPIWSRESLVPRNPPHISFPHPEYKNCKPIKIYQPSDFHAHMQSSLFLSRTAVSAIKTLAGASASFDAVAALFWRSRARAIGLAKTDIAHILYPVDTRHLQGVSLLPKGYYGAAVIFPCASATVEELCQQPLSNAASKIAMTKQLASQPEYRSSVIDYLEVHPGQIGFRCGKEAFVVSDQSKLKFAGVNFGWGRALYGGPGRAGTGSEPGMVAAVVSHCQENGEEGLLLIFTMTEEAIDPFRNEVLKTVLEATEYRNRIKVTGVSADTFVKSAL